MIGLIEYINEERTAWNRKWNKKTCREEAKKYKSRAEFVKGNESAYRVARKNGWLDDYDWFEIKRKPKSLKEYLLNETTPL